ncbi:hypothetical protein C4573_01795 [Candidatus Woesearchaeota archaeon]|nr:MAG: hypothetical protein C4573_01795 [Candidatus Woesearchaeota archaeon]
MEPTIIAVLGGPGTGKSFLVKKLAEYYNAETILESLEKIPPRIIENFKKDIRQMETILWFRNKQLEEIESAIALKKKGKIVIMDTCQISNDLHITTMTQGFEEEILLKMVKGERKYFPQPDILVFLDASEKKIREFTFKRGWDFDTNEKFLKRNLSIQKAHKEYCKQHKKEVVYMNRDKLDFNKKEDLKKVIDAIERFKNQV